jgi:asparagine synthase (glutamine-hydrolysing)
MVSLTDGMYLSHGLTEMLALDFLGHTGIEVLLRGHGGELAKTDLAWPLHTDPRIHRMKNSADLVPYLTGRVGHVSSASDRARLFTPDWVELITDSPRASVERSLKPVNLSPADACSYLYLMEHHRRFTISSLELFRHQVEVRLPFADHDFLRCLFRAPAQWRSSVEIHRSLMSAHNQALLRVRNSNTGAPANASPFVEKVLDKINTVFKRLNVRGYRHYHSLDTWMKARLVESVESVLLDRVALDRGIVTERGLRRILSDTKNGVVDRSLLLQALLIVELWQRENV